MLAIDVKHREHADGGKLVVWVVGSLELGSIIRDFR